MTAPNDNNNYNTHNYNRPLSSHLNKYFLLKDHNNHFLQCQQLQQHNNNSCNANCNQQQQHNNNGCNANYNQPVQQHNDKHINTTTQQQQLQY